MRYLIWDTNYNGCEVNETISSGGMMKRNGSGEEAGGAVDRDAMAVYLPYKHETRGTSASRSSTDHACISTRMSARGGQQGRG